MSEKLFDTSSYDVRSDGSLTVSAAMVFLFWYHFCERVALNQVFLIGSYNNPESSYHGCYVGRDLAGREKIYFAQNWKDFCSEVDDWRELNGGVRKHRLLLMDREDQSHG